MECNLRIGIGYDAHRLVPDRPLIIGGVQIPHPRGLLGHSDADVLTHAVMDALLGAAALGDIGRHFPDTDNRYRGVSSLLLLARVGALLRSRGFEPVNLDMTVFAQEPRIAPHTKAMQAKISGSLEVDPERLNIKATTTENLGWIGRGEGIAAQCVALVSHV